MSDWLQIVRTSSLTVISAVIIYIISSCIDSVFFSIRKEYLELHTEITVALIYHAKRIHNPLIYVKDMPDRIFDNYNNAGNELRKLATKLFAISQKVRNKCARRFAGLPDAGEIIDVRGRLIRLSNSLIVDKSTIDLDREGNIEDVKEIRSILNIDKV